MPTAADHQQAILNEIGAALPLGPPLDVVSAMLMDAMGLVVPALWNLWADKALIWPRLQYLYTKRQALEVLEGQLRGAVQASMGPISQADNQKFDHLKTLWDQANAEITVLLGQANASRGAAVGRLTQRAPIMPGDMDPSLIPALMGYRDPNHPVYVGNPAFPPWLYNLGYPYRGG